MAFLDISPLYRDVLTRAGLAAAGDFLRLGGVITCGHPDRNVARLELGPAGDLPVFLKREHRVPWRDRWANAWAGFGFVSKSRRESVILQQLAASGVGCPEVVAVGEDGGSAFLLLRAISGAMELRRHLAACREPHRRHLAVALGRALARIHASGFDHPDLYAKHVLVSSDDEPRLHFLDWQRSRRRPAVSWARRCRDLAALDATLADDLATPRERLRCLAAYLRATPHAPPLRRVAAAIRRRAQALLRKRRIRELRQALPGREVQGLIWLDGEALCVTPAFAAELGGHVPDWLRLDAAATDGVRHGNVPLSDGRVGLLTQRVSRHPLAWLGRVLGRQRPTSPELAQAAQLFRLERDGAAGPRLLAVGQKQVGATRILSLLLTEAPAGAGEVPR
jgi:tRNA A-37 threonylcarbamoyl transferase component Bud32